MKLNLRPRTQPEVNMTSLIDVVFLLLIFFMVSTSFVKQSKITISLPEVESQLIVEAVPEQIDIMITETGTIFINGRQYNGPGLAKYLKMWVEEELAVNR